MVSLFRRNKGGNKKEESSVVSQGDTSGNASRDVNTPKKTSGASSKKGNPSDATATFRVRIPPNVKPGKEFQVYGKCTSKRIPASSTPT
mmetsp:Transcript_5029/g.7426  ORF Transcript_5029/g.7426 Transcript_5029/m.7426 type:complete len:89 (+) Transcript_5029:169-435(+)